MHEILRSVPDCNWRVETNNKRTKWSKTTQRQSHDCKVIVDFSEWFLELGLTLHQIMSTIFLPTHDDGCSLKQAMPIWYIPLLPSNCLRLPLRNSFLPSFPHFCFFYLLKQNMPVPQPQYFPVARVLEECSWMVRRNFWWFLLYNILCLCIIIYMTCDILHMFLYIAIVPLPDCTIKHLSKRVPRNSYTHLHTNMNTWPLPYWLSRTF